MNCPVCGLPCEETIDTEGIPVYSCPREHDTSGFDIQEVIDDFEEFPVF